MKKKDLDRIHSYRKAIKNKVYTLDNGDIYIGTVDGRVKRVISGGDSTNITEETTIIQPLTGVQSVTGLDVDNTDPANPVINIAVDGITITGDGTSGNPLVASVPPTPDLEEVLTAGNDGGGLEITNIADGTADTSAATVGQLREVNYGIAYSGTVTHSQNETSARALVSFTIPAGTLEVGDMVMIEFVTRKTSGSGSNTFQCKVNSAAGTGGTILAQYSQTAIQSFNGLGRFLVTGASAEIGWAAINGNAYGVAAVDTTSITLPIASDIFINMVNQKNTGTDLFDLRAANVRIVKYRP